MNNKILSATTALASIMALSSAQADINVGRNFNGMLGYGEYYGSQERISITKSAYDTYTDTLEKGMGIKVGMAFGSCKGG